MGTANEEQAGMRADVALARLRIVEPREQAKRACENGIVDANGKNVKPASIIRVGDTIRVRFTDQELVIKITSLPPKSLSRARAQGCFVVLSDKATVPGA